MGTNFWAITDDGDEIHLGKRSAGWRFGFQATEWFTTVRELTGWLENTPLVTISDEYGREYDPVTFMTQAIEHGKDWERPDGSKGGHRHHATCWCGPDPSIHGPYDAIWRQLRSEEYIDTETDTDWIRGEFS